MATRQEVNSPLILTIGAVSAVLFVVIALGTEAWFRYEQDREIESKWHNAKNEQLDTILAQQRAKITTEAPMPIDQAIARTIQNRGKLQ